MVGTIQGFQLSPQQRHVCLTQRDGAAYRSVCAVLLEGRLKAEDLRAALRAVVGRHEILRTAFRQLPSMRVPLQVVSPTGEVLWRHLDARGAEDGRRASLVGQFYGEACRAPFDLEAGPVLHATHLEFADDRHALILALPALCADALSLKNLFTEASECYAAARQGRKCEGRETLQYVQYAGWQNGVLHGEGAGEGAEFWARVSAEGPAGLRLPFEQNRATAAPFAPARLDAPAASLPAAQLEAAAGAGSREVFLLACWQTLLWRLTQSPRVVVSTLFDGRPFEELETALGPFAKSLPVVAEFGNDLSFAEVLRETSRRVDEAARMEKYFRPDGGQAPPPDRGAPGIAFDYLAWPAEQVFADASARLYAHYSCAHPFRLRLSCLDDGAQVRPSLDYDPALLEPSDAERLMGYFTALLESALDDPTAPVRDLRLLRERETRRLLEEWSVGDTFDAEGLCLHEAFKRQAASAPTAVALECGDERRTYDELNRAANSLAHYLSARGVGPEVRVAICAERSVEMVVGVLGILKAGGAYVPLEPSYPGEYLAHMLDDAGAGLLLTTSRARGALPRHSLPTICLDLEWGQIAARGGEQNIVSGVTADNLAYVIYTSGSTGRPNGVMVSHRSVINLAGALGHAVYGGVAGRLRGSLNAPLAFDASVKQLVLLTLGHTLHVIPEEVRRDGEALHRYLHEHGIDVFDCTPSQLKLLLQSAAAGGGGVRLPRLLLIGGEPIDEATWRTLSALEGTDAFNVYGPTEATVDATCRLVRDAAAPDIGRPLPNVQALILDPDLRLVPAGVRGEIHLGGAGLARGYLNRPTLTAERFVPHPYAKRPGERLYRTGDLARHLPGGAFEFAGRRDSQVKVRGFRVELGEIQRALKSHPAVRDALVLTREAESGGNRLFAYVVPRDVRALKFGGRKPYRLPNDMVVAQLSKHETDYLFKEIFEDETYVRHGIELRDGDCVFDVGANIGLATLFFHYHRRDLRVFSFEPIPALFEILKLNRELHDVGGRALPYGVSDRARQATISFYPDYSIMSGLYADAAEEEETVRTYILNQEQPSGDDTGALLSHLGEFLQGRFESQEVHCQLRTLSDVIRDEQVERVDLLKIDVQKSELDVLAGIEPQDWAKVSQIVMEVHDYDGHLEAAAALLKEKGYELVMGQDALLKNTDRHHIYATRGRRRPQPSSNGGRRAAAGLDFSIDDLRNYVKANLPEHMQPAAYFLLGELPLTANGKVDVGALPAEIDPQLGGAFVAPRTPMERLLSDIWAEVLGLGNVGIYDHFFELGGDSITQVQIVVKVNREGVRLLPKHMYQHPTIAELAPVAEGLRVGDSERAGGHNAPPLTPPRASAGGGAYTPSDFPEAGLTQEELDEIIARLTGEKDGGQR